jgi:hypothetical protein
MIPGNNEPLHSQYIVPTNSDPRVDRDANVNIVIQNNNKDTVYYDIGKESNDLVVNKQNKKDQSSTRESSSKPDNASKSHLKSKSNSKPNQKLDIHSTNLNISVNDNTPIKNEPITSENRYTFGKDPKESSPINNSD